MLLSPCSSTNVLTIAKLLNLLTVGPEWRASSTISFCLVSDLFKMSITSSNEIRNFLCSLEIKSSLRDAVIHCEPAICADSPQVAWAVVRWQVAELDSAIGEADRSRRMRRSHSRWLWP